MFRLGSLESAFMLCILVIPLGFRQIGKANAKLGGGVRGFGTEMQATIYPESDPVGQKP